MLRQLSVRVAPVTNRAADFAPVAPACCNACRTCTTTNLVGLAFAVAGGVALALGRVARRLRPARYV